MKKKREIKFRENGPKMKSKIVEKLQQLRKKFLEKGKKLSKIEKKRQKLEEKWRKRGQK